MSDKTVKGIVIKTAEVKENDLIITISTPEGLKSLYGRGLKKMTSKNAHACQLLDCSEFLIEDSMSREILMMKSATLKKDFVNIKGDYDRLALASVVAEISSKLEDEDLFMLIFRTLDNLDRTKEPYTVFNLFVVEILNRLGIAPVVDGCVICGEENGIETVSIADGGFICRDCNSQTHINPRDVNFLRRFRIINKATFDVLDKIYGIGLNDYEITAMLVEFLMTHSGMTLRSWRSVQHA